MIRDEPMKLLFAAYNRGNDDDQAGPEKVPG